MGAPSLSKSPLLCVTTITVPIFVDFAVVLHGVYVSIRSFDALSNMIAAGYGRDTYAASRDPYARDPFAPQASAPSRYQPTARYMGMY
jgi:hypothetical protein